MIREVAIADCVHYCGFRYGRDEFNPYENYIVGLARGQNESDLQARFVDFLRFYRPRNLGEALSVTTRKPIPLWLLPWKSWRKLFRPGGWQETPEQLVDILTHFSPKGIEKSRIDEEFGWLERAWTSIRNDGYQPSRLGYITVFELRSNRGSRYLVLDGNHRISALHASGEKKVRVSQPLTCYARRQWARVWPLVLSGHLDLDDALAVFDGYFEGNNNPFRAQEPADVIG